MWKRQANALAGRGNEENQRVTRAASQRLKNGSSIEPPFECIENDRRLTRIVKTKEVSDEMDMSQDSLQDIEEPESGGIEHYTAEIEIDNKRETFYLRKSVSADHNQIPFIDDDKVLAHSETELPVDCSPELNNAANKIEITENIPSHVRLNTSILRAAISTPPILRELDRCLDATSPSKYILKPAFNMHAKKHGFQNIDFSPLKEKQVGFHLNKSSTYVVESEEKNTLKVGEKTPVMGCDGKLGGITFSVNAPSPKGKSNGPLESTEVETQVLILKLFESAPYVDFKRVLVGSTKFAKLKIQNPSSNTITINNIKMPKEKTGFTCNLELPATVSGYETIECQILWKPRDCGNHRESIYFDCGNRQKFQVILVGECYTPPPPKQVKKVRRAIQTVPTIPVRQNTIVKRKLEKSAQNPVTTSKNVVPAKKSLAPMNEKLVPMKKALKRK